MRRLYLKLYLTFLGVAVLALFAAWTSARLMVDHDGPPARYLGGVARALLRDPAVGAAGPFHRLRAVSDELGVDIALWDAGGRVMIEASQGPFPPPQRLRRGWHRGGVFVIGLEGGRFLGVRERGRGTDHFTVLLGVLGVVGVVMALGLYPLARGITRRLEALAEGARRFGGGELEHRVPVQGSDEIAAVAARFNQAASALAALLEQQRRMLANASHELRSPLARLRMALELCAEEADPERRRRLVEKAHGDIVDLDALVEDVLLTARAEPGVPRRPLGEVDLAALVGAEAERAGGVTVIAPAAQPVRLQGDAPMLRHLVRNLLTNARIHGGPAEGQGPAEIRATLDVVGEGAGAAARLAVEDRGPGIPAHERERIFAPFYRPPAAPGSPERPAPHVAGAGLGLALVRQVARYHGGDVRYLPRPGGGSRFEVSLPLAPPPAGPAPATAG
jgi:two-component system, OmpR family, sensor kinase